MVNLTTDYVNLVAYGAGALAQLDLYVDKHRAKHRLCHDTRKNSSQMYL